MTEKEKTLARDAEKYVIRFPDGMRSGVERLAKDRGISMNTAIVKAIEIYLNGQEREKQLLDLLEERTLPKAVEDAKPEGENDEDRDYLDGISKDDD